MHLCLVLIPKSDFQSQWEI